MELNRIFVNRKQVFVFLTPNVSSAFVLLLLSGQGPLTRESHVVPVPVVGFETVGLATPSLSSG